MGEFASAAGAATYFTNSSRSWRQVHVCHWLLPVRINGVSVLLGFYILFSDFFMFFTITGCICKDAHVSDIRSNLAPLIGKCFQSKEKPSCSVFGDNFLFIHHNWKFYLVHLLTKPVLVSGLLLPWGSCLTLLFPCVSFAVLLGSVGQPFQGAYLEISENPKYKKLKDAVDEKIIIAEVVNKINRANGKVITWIYLIYPAG